MTDEKYQEVANAIAHDEKADEVEDTTLSLLHAIPTAFGSDGVVVDEEAARAGPCRCVPNGKEQSCFAPGVVGELSGEQKDRYCKVVEDIDPLTAERIAEWHKAVEKCKAETASMTDKDKIGGFIRCFVSELKEPEKQEEVKEEELQKKLDTRWGERIWEH